MAEQKPQGQWERMTVAQKADVLAGVAGFPAMTIMVFLRRKLGYRFLDPLRLQVMTLLLFGLASFSVFSGNTLSILPLIVFALVMFIIAMFKRRAMWWLILYGERWHTYSRGISWFNFLFMEETARQDAMKPVIGAEAASFISGTLAILFPTMRETTVKRFVDPIVAAVIGFLFSLLFPWLGYYIMFSAACLFIFETADYQKALNRQLDMYDNLIDSEVMSEVAEHYQREGGVSEMPVEETAGIATGTDANLTAAIERRKARQRQQDSQIAPSQDRVMVQKDASGNAAQESDTDKGRFSLASPAQGQDVTEKNTQPSTEEVVIVPSAGEVVDIPAGTNPDLSNAMNRRKSRRQGQVTGQLAPSDE